jgi:hypothetical protein
MFTKEIIKEVKVVDEVKVKELEAQIIQLKADFESEKRILGWEVNTNRLAQTFVHKYFGELTEYFWVSDEIGGTLCAGDYFFSLQDILDALRYKASKKKMFEYYDNVLEKAMKDEKPDYNLKNYLKLRL